MSKPPILITLTILILSACNPPDNKTMDPQATPIDKSMDTFTSGYAPVNGLKMYYEIHGEGMPLVLIHGGGSTIQTTFGRVLQAFAKTHKVIAVEMQAHGRTADIDRPLSFTQDADDIAALLKYLKIDKADIFGFSNGAITTLQCAIRHPELVNKIVVASTFYSKSGAPSWFWEMMSNATFEGMPRLLKEAYLKLNPDSNALHRMYERDVTRMQSFTDIPEQQMKSIKAPAFIIIGDKDVVTPEHAVEMHRLLPNSRLAILPGGHGDYIGEITTAKDDALISATIDMVNKFLNEPRQARN
jgi:pimeloyl-ACP methyl ester carboxylesterase